MNLCFEDFLKEVHAREYMGLDDDMPDAFDVWLGDLNGEDYIRYGDEFVAEVRRALVTK